MFVDDHSTYVAGRLVRPDLVPMARAVELYSELISPTPRIPSPATCQAIAERLARFVPLFDLDGKPVDKAAPIDAARLATTRAALDAALALMRR